MVSSINPSAQQFLDSLSTIQTRLNTSELQMSSGLKVNQASDAPDELSPILALHAAIQKNADIQTGLSSAKTMVDAGESALSSAVTLLTSAQSLATEGLGASETATERTTLAASVEGLQEQMVNLSQTTSGGLYVFGGDAPETASYQLDLTATDGVDRLAVTGNSAMVEGSGGQQFTATLSANTVFDQRDTNDDATSNNVFAALNGLRVALLANDTAGITASVSALQTASTYMNTQLAVYGQSQDRITSETTAATNQETSLKSQLSGLEDADMTTAITALTQGQTQMQAAISAQARMPTTTLFDVLPNT